MLTKPTYKYTKHITNNNLNFFSKEYEMHYKF